jgi:hypothetical protein
MVNRVLGREKLGCDIVDLPFRNALEKFSPLPEEKKKPTPLLNRGTGWTHNGAIHQPAGNDPANIQHHYFYQ